MEKNITTRLSEFSTKINFNDLPKEVVKVEKTILLDAIVCALGSYITEKTKYAIKFATEMGGNPLASIIGGCKTSYGLASFVNGELMNSLNFEVCNPISGHPYSRIAPPCLSIAEKVKASEAETILALALAHKIGERVGRTLNQHRGLINDPPYYREFPRTTYGNKFKTREEAK